MHNSQEKSPLRPFLDPCANKCSGNASPKAALQSTVNTPVPCAWSCHGAPHLKHHSETPQDPPTQGHSPRKAEHLENTAWKTNFHLWVPSQTGAVKISAAVQGGLSEGPFLHQLGHGAGREAANKAPAT